MQRQCCMVSFLSTRITRKMEILWRYEWALLQFSLYWYFHPDIYGLYTVLLDRISILKVGLKSEKCFISLLWGSFCCLGSKDPWLSHCISPGSWLLQKQKTSHNAGPNSSRETTSLSYLLPFPWTQLGWRDPPWVWEWCHVTPCPCLPSSWNSFRKRSGRRPKCTRCIRSRHDPASVFL